MSKRKVNFRLGPRAKIGAWAGPRGQFPTALNHEHKLTLSFIKLRKDFGRFMSGYYDRRGAIFLAVFHHDDMPYELGGRTLFLQVPANRVTGVWMSLAGVPSP